MLIVLWYRSDIRPTTGSYINEKSIIYKHVNPSDSLFYNSSTSFSTALIDTLHVSVVIATKEQFVPI